MTKEPLAFLLLCLLIISSSLIMAQQPEPLEIRKAYQRATRSITGLPGPNYWQNRADYQIAAEVMADRSMLTGEAIITYFNFSPDTLQKLVLRLYPDLYKKGNPRNWSLMEDELTNGMTISYLVLNQDSVDLGNRRAVSRSETNLHVSLAQDLLPGDSLQIRTAWAFQIPTRTIRMGNYGNDRFFLAYWYPQVAVYDDIDGWDQVEYHGTVEYYNDFNDYRVTITAPEGFAVWATGSLMNAGDLFVTEVYDRWQKAMTSDDIIQIFTAQDCRNNTVLKSETKTNWEFRAIDVPDFSFALAREMNWEGSSVLVDTAAGRRVFVDAVYPESTRTFHRAAEWSRLTVNYFSFDMPGVPFPYPHMTSFCNGRRGGGMETPMMANNGDPYNDGQALGLIAHENAHSYFPFMMGVNERKYAWMDEGWAVYFPLQLMESEIPDYNYPERLISAFERINGKEKESPLMVLSYQITDYASYRNHAYDRSAMAYYFLGDLLGEELFQRVLREYMERWEGKHPTPYDFFNTLADLSGQHLQWFIRPWFYEKAYADQGIKKVTLDNKIVVENVGGLPMPVILKCEFEDGSEQLIQENTAVWRFGEPAVVLEADPNKKIRKLLLGGERIPDINELNNILEPGYD